MRKNFQSVVVIFSILLMVSCLTTKELDLNGLSEKEFTFEYLSVSVANDTDGDGMNFIPMQMPTLIHEIKADVKSRKGLDLNVDDFLKALEEDSLNIEAKENVYGDIVLNYYIWDNPNRYNQGFGLLIDVVVTENGSIPTTLVLNKDNPDKPGERISTSFPITVIIEE